MAGEINETVCNCPKYARSRKWSERKQHLQFLPATKPLEFIGQDIFGFIPGEKNGNVLAVRTTDWYSKMTRVIPAPETRGTHAAIVFLDSLYCPMRFLEHLLTEKGSHFTRKFFETLCGFLGLKHLPATPYQPQTNAHVETYNKTTVTRLRQCAAEHQDILNIFAEPLTYAYNTFVHRSIEVLPISVVLTGDLPEAGTFDFPSAICMQLSCNICPRILRNSLLPRLALIKENVDEQLNSAQKECKYDFRKRVRQKTVSIRSTECA